MKKISGSKNGNVEEAKYSVVLSELSPEHAKGTSYRNSQGRTVRAIEQPILEPGKTYYIVIKSSPYYLYYWLYDEKGRDTGYNYIAGEA